jgi:hypothetical protein
MNGTVTVTYDADLWTVRLERTGASFRMLYAETLAAAEAAAEELRAALADDDPWAVRLVTAREATQPPGGPPPSSGRQKATTGDHACTTPSTPARVRGTRSVCDCGQRWVRLDRWHPVDSRGRLNNNLRTPGL